MCWICEVYDWSTCSTSELSYNLAYNPKLPWPSILLLNANNRPYLEMDLRTQAQQRNGTLFYVYLSKPIFRLSPTSQALSDLSIPTNDSLSVFESEFSDVSNALLSSYLTGSPHSDSDDAWEWIPAPRRDVDVRLPCEVPLVPTYDKVLYDQWNSSTARHRDREISETRGRYMHRVSSTSTKIILPPTAGKGPSNKTPLSPTRLNVDFLVTLLTYLFSIEEAVLTLLTAPSSQLGSFPGGDLSKETEIKPPQREDAYLNEWELHGVRKFFVQHGHQPHRSIRDGFYTTSRLLGDTPPSLFTASTCFLDLVSDVIASGGKVLREAFHSSCYD